MSKQDNLTDFLTDVADAIREKKGTTEKINPQNFSEEIMGIETGSGIVPCEFKDVNFYDYEGTILYSYTWDEFVAKNEMPPLPMHHEGLTCQEWNYTLEEVLEQGGRCDVGAIYNTEDGHTRIHVDTSNKKDIVIQVKAFAGEVTIYWGDGVVEQLPKNNAFVSKKHIYQEEKKYTIHINSAGSYEILISFAPNMSYIYGGNKLERLFIVSSLVKNITIPNGCRYDGGLFNVTLRHINIPRTQTAIYSNSFNASWSFESISLPNTVTFISSFLDNALLKALHIPTNVPDITFSSIKSAYSMCSISVSKKSQIRCENNCLILNDKVILGINGCTIPKGVTQIGDYACKNSVAASIDLPDSVTHIGKEAFNGLTYPYGVGMGKNIEAIDGRAFAYMREVKYFSFVAYEHIPNLTNANAFVGMPTGCVIVIPDALYDQWIAATNWSAHASRIVKASEFIEPTTE